MIRNRYNYYNLTVSFPKIGQMAVQNKKKSQNKTFLSLLTTDDLMQKWKLQKKKKKKKKKKKMTKTVIAVSLSDTIQLSRSRILTKRVKIPGNATVTKYNPPEAFFERETNYFLKKLQIRHLKILNWSVIRFIRAAFRNASYSRLFGPQSLLLLALVIRYRDSMQNTFTITLHFWMQPRSVELAGQLGTPLLWRHQWRLHYALWWSTGRCFTPTTRHLIQSAVK